MENKQKNNDIIVDLILKTSKLNASLTQLLDVNNFKDNDLEVILSSEEYHDVQEHIINSFKLLNDKYVEIVKKLYNVEKGE